MPQIKIDLVQVGGIKEYADGSVDIDAVDRVRGNIVIRMQGDEARWFFASCADKLNEWRKRDGEDA